MDFNDFLQQLNRFYSVHIPSVLEADFCSEMIERIDACQNQEDTDLLFKELCASIEPSLFNSEMRSLLECHYGKEADYRWPRLDVIDDTAIDTYYSTTWHCDNGPNGLLKFFIYLNPVEEHGCNTEFYDIQTTKKLQRADALPEDLAARHLDVTPFLETVDPGEESNRPRSYNLAAGDVHIFDSINLAHRCKPPKQGKKRYTISYNVFPKSSVG